MPNLAARRELARRDRFRGLTQRVREGSHRRDPTHDLAVPERQRLGLSRPAFLRRRILTALPPDAPQRAERVHPVGDRFCIPNGRAQAIASATIGSLGACAAGAVCSRRLCCGTPAVATVRREKGHGLAAALRRAESRRLKITGNRTGSTNDHRLDSQRVRSPCCRAQAAVTGECDPPRAGGRTTWFLAW